MINIIISGINGQMGQTLSRVAQRDGEINILAGVDVASTGRESFPVFEHPCDAGQADVLIDFSRPAALGKLLEYGLKKNVPLVLATTGYSDKDKQAIRDASAHIPIFFVANMSLGVNLQMDLCKQAAGFFGQSVDIEIIEKHHNKKVDSPSGTALALADSINAAYENTLEYKYGRSGYSPRQQDEIGIHSVRGGSIVGEHQVLFIKDDEIIEINHFAQSKEVFAVGAVRAAKFIVGRPAGMYTMHDIIYENRAVTNLSVETGQATVTLSGIAHNTGETAKIFDAVAAAGISVDIITQTVPKDGLVDVCFSIPEKALEDTAKALVSAGLPKPSIMSGLCKLTVAGAGMERRHGVAARLFGTLAKNGIDLAIVTTSEMKISFCTDQDRLETAKRIIIDEFNI